MNVVPLEQLSFDTFAGLAGTQVRVWIQPDDSLNLQLCEVTPAKFTETGGLKYECFTLVFLGPADRLLPQQIYTFAAEPIGRFEMFIVPVGRDQAGIRYEATFNRLVTSR